MTTPIHEQFPSSSIICLESRELEDASYLLSQDIALAKKTGDAELIEEIRSSWEGESWEDIVGKARVESSMWYVWWMDGVRKYLLSAKSSEQQDH